MFSSEQEAKAVFDLISARSSSDAHPIAQQMVHKHNPSQVVIGDVGRIDPEDLSAWFPREAGTNVFYGQAIPNLDCEVCFDHPLDHYPLMMIFEIGRQLGIAISHQFYDIPLQGFINIVDSLSFEFKTFLELDKPVYVVCVDSDIKDKKGIHRRKMELAFLQEGVHCASGGGNVSVFRRALYDRMRAASRTKVLGEPVRCARSIPTNLDVGGFAPALAV